MNRRGLVIVISAPSGAGKSTLCGRLVRKLPHIVNSISCTTRPMRPGEIEGRHYFFVSEEKFKAMIKKGEFVEWANVHGHLYGTPRKYLEKNIRSGIDTLLNIDVQGGLSIRAMFPDAVMIFVMAPSMKELERRLRGRKQDTDREIRKRLANARTEIRSLKRYEYLIINDRIPAAMRELEAILTAEHRKLAHLPNRYVQQIMT